MQATPMRPLPTLVDVDDPSAPLGPVAGNADDPDQLASVVYLWRDFEGPRAEDIDEILSARCACL